MQSAEDAARPTVVLVHGAFADGSSWDRVVPLLLARGLKVVAVQNPLSSLADDVAATRRVLDMQAGPVVLVGHSWGGVVISEVGLHASVRSLVYVAAFAPSEGQSVVDLGKGYPAPSGGAHLYADKEGFLRLDDDGIAKHFAQDLPADQTSLMAVSQGPVRAANFEERTSVAAWKQRPSWYVVAENDNMIRPEQQRAMAIKIGASVTSVPTSHVPMLARPTDIASAILATAAAAR
jgi:pimeloyl-ACP methyl ester carboxylesterase